MTETPFFTRLPGRGLIRINGPDRFTFLQGLITNDLDKLTPSAALYACLLTPQGKFLHDFFVTDSNGAYLLECEGDARAEDLAARLTRYKLRADVEIKAEKNLEIYGCMGIENEKSIGPMHFVYADPRHRSLGFRSFSKPDLPEGPFSAWDQRRIRLCIPDGSRDLTPEQSTLDEARMDQINAVDYAKGCYVGQELTARMHYRGLGKKHLYAVTSQATLPPPGADIHHDGSIIGEMRSSCGSIGLALLKDEAADKMATHDGLKMISGAS